MKTARPIATISYNSESKLKSVLDELIRKGVIRFYMAAYHFAEKDELKDHWHVYMEPDGSLDTHELADLFIELVPGKPPLRCKSIVNSKFDHAYMYFLHDADYLEGLGQSRVHHYSPDSLIVSDRIDLNEHVRTIDYTKFTSLGSAIRAARSGITLDEYLATHAVKMVHFRSLQDIFKTYYKAPSDPLRRAGRCTHTPRKHLHYRSVPLSFRNKYKWFIPKIYLRHS